MAKMAQQEVKAITIWMIVFVALWLTSTVLLVVLYTGQEELKNDRNRFQSALRKLISSSEENSVPQFKEAKEGGPTLIGLVEGARGDTATLATGSKTDDPASIRNKRDTIVGQIVRDKLVPSPRTFEDASLHDALSKLYEIYKAEAALRTKLDARVKELESEFEQMTQAVALQKNELDKRAKQIADQLAQVEGDRDSFRTTRNEAVAKLEKDFDVRRELTDKDLTEARQRNKALEREKQILQERFGEQEAKFGELLIRPGQLSTARQADGRVLTARPGDDVVSIDLGRKDSLLLGMKFAVYDGRTGIPTDGKAKAQIEVVSISKNYAECRIVSVEGLSAILNGDLIANPVYDRTRPVNFLVIGDFDLDRDGAPDPDGAKTVEAMITTWGGKTATEVSAMTDFLVVGMAPPKSKKSADAPPEEVQRRAALQRNLDRYNELLASAKSLAIPVMNQEVFLNFLGYRNRYTVR